jgi:hypothetical protein
LNVEVAATIKPPSGEAGLYTEPGAIHTNGIPFACAVTIETMLDLPMSIEPPDTAAATAEPLVARVRAMSSPPRRIAPVCCAYNTGIVSSAGDEDKRSVVSSAGALCARAFAPAAST